MSQERPTKVLFVTFDVVPDPTGTSARTTELLKGLTPYFQVDALTAKTPDHSHIERYHGVRLLRVPVGQGDVRSRADAFDRAVRRQLQSEEYDLVHFTDPFGGYALAELRHHAGYRLVYEPRGFPSIELVYTDPELEGDLRFLTKLRRQEIFCLMNSDVVMATNEQSRGYVASLGVPDEKVHVIPAPVDTQAFSVPERKGGGPCRFVYTGSHASWQGLPSLLFALRVAAKQTSLECRIVGPTHGSWLRQLQEMVREFGLRDHVRIESPVPHEDVPAILGACDVGLAPLQKGDRNQVQGAASMKIAEYLVAGRPVVAADLEVSRAMIEDGETGLLYPPSDEDALAERIVRLAEDPELRARLGRTARSRAARRFDTETVRSAVLRIYQELVSPSVIISDEAYAPEEPSRPAPEAPTVTFYAAFGEEGPTTTVPPEEITQLASSVLPSEEDTASAARPPSASPPPSEAAAGEVPILASDPPEIDASESTPAVASVLTGPGEDAPPLPAAVDAASEPPELDLSEATPAEAAAPDLPGAGPPSAPGPDEETGAVDVSAMPWAGAGSLTAELAAPLESAPSPDGSPWSEEADTGSADVAAFAEPDAALAEASQRPAPGSRDAEVVRGELIADDEPPEDPPAPPPLPSGQDR